MAMMTTHLDGKARAGIPMLTMDRRQLNCCRCRRHRQPPDRGDAKILRTPGAQLHPTPWSAASWGVHSLNVNRIMVVTHTRCVRDGQHRRRGVAQGDSGASSGKDVSTGTGADPQQRSRLVADVAALRSHELIGPFAEVGGFSYDVDWGRLTQLVSGGRVAKARPRKWVRRGYAGSIPW